MDRLADLFGEEISVLVDDKLGDIILNRLGHKGGKGFHLRFTEENFCLPDELLFKIYRLSDRFVCLCHKYFLSK